MANTKIIEKYRTMHFGESNIANNGMKMFIIAYRNNEDIDILFEDGTIVTNKRYKNFTKGKVSNPNVGLPSQKRIGEVMVANNGQKMIIIKYVNSDCIDIQFENGTIVTNKTYQLFKGGMVRNSNSIIGETNTATNGQLITIIACRSRKDIDVQFEDGTVIEHKRYHDFKMGCIFNPNKPYRNRKYFPQAKTKVGESIVANNGQKMTIVEYFNFNNLTVQFEDGTIVKSKTYQQFKKGGIRNPNHNYGYRHIGKTVRASNNMLMTIIEFRNKLDIDVQFENGVIVRNKKYSNFLKGYIKCPAN